MSNFVATARSSRVKRTKSADYIGLSICGIAKRLTKTNRIAALHRYIVVRIYDATRLGSFFVICYLAIFKY